MEMSSSAQDAVAGGGPPALLFTSKLRNGRSELQKIEAKNSNANTPHSLRTSDDKHDKENRVDRTPTARKNARIGASRRWSFSVKKPVENIDGADVAGGSGGTSNF